MRKQHSSIMKIALISILVGLALSSHLDDDNSELSNYSFNKVNFKLQKDCSLDKIPDIKNFLEVESVKYPALDVFLSEGEPRFELLKDGTHVDTIRVTRYDKAALRRLCEELGLKRDDSYTWEKKKAQVDLSKAFKSGGGAPSSLKAEL
jgi:hypothetical protein